MLRPFLCAVGFLTRIPLPYYAWSDAEVARGAGYFAWVGVVIGVLLGVTAQLSSVVGNRTAALLVVAVWAFISGGLHLDGLADAIDGLSGGRGERQRTLTIMRDSRIGAHGALALVVLVLLKWSALERLLDFTSLRWCAVPVLSRYLCTLLMARFPYARSEGLGRVFAGQVGSRELLIGAVALVPMVTLAGPNALWATLAGASASLLVARHFQRLLGGLTGDVYGAAIEISEASSLIVLSLR